MTDRTVTDRAPGGSASIRCVSERLKPLRRAAGLTQDALAERLGITQAAVSGYEHGRRMPTSLVPRIAAVLGCNVAELLPAPAEPTPRARTRRRRSDPSLRGERFCQTLCHFRSRARLTLADVASRAGFPQAVLSQMEAGLIPVEGADARVLAPILGTTPGELLSGRPGTRTSGSVLQKAFDVAGRPILAKGVVPQEHHQALYELGLRDTPALNPKASEASKPKQRPLYPVGAGVESYRRVLGLTQAELARAAGISQPAISAIENGQGPLPRAVWEALATEFGVHPADLGTGEWLEAV